MLFSLALTKTHATRHIPLVHPGGSDISQCHTSMASHEFLVICFARCNSTKFCFTRRNSNNICVKQRRYSTNIGLHNKILSTFVLQDVTLPYLCCLTNSFYICVTLPIFVLHNKNCLNIFVARLNS